MKNDAIARCSSRRKKEEKRRRRERADPHEVADSILVICSSPNVQMPKVSLVNTPSVIYQLAVYHHWTSSHMTERSNQGVELTLKSIL